MADLLAVAGLGMKHSILVSRLDSLNEAVKEAMINSRMFRPILQDLEVMLESMQPLVREELPHDVLHQLERYPEKMQYGAELLRKFSKIRALNLYKKYKYSIKLLELEKSLRDVLDILRIQAMNNAAKTWIPVINAEIVMSAKMAYRTREPELPYDTVGLDEPLEEVKKKLLSEDISVLVLTGAGGCGKTTLATAIYLDAKIRGRFSDNIFFITVGKRPNISSMCEQLNQRASPIAAPSFQDEVSDDTFLTLLKQRGQNSLLIFDDVWPETESLIDQIVTEGKKKMLNYKILVTSRYQFPLLGSSYHMNLLNAEDSMTLLRHSAFPGDMYINVPIDLLIEIVKHCRGHPLTTIVVGKSLCGKPIEVWRNTLFKWSKGYSILDYENDLLFSVLQSSLEDLGNVNETFLESFLDLTSFPDDQAIHVPVIFDIWPHLYSNLCDDSLCFENLNELTTRSLVNVVVRRNLEQDYSEHYVTQHDILRSLAIHQAQHDPELSKRLNIDIRGDTIPKWWTEVAEQKKTPKTVSLLSISTDEAFPTKWPKIQVPVAEVLILNLRTKNYELPKFIRDMHKSLKVLVVQNYGSVAAEISQFHRLTALSNLKTVRMHRITVPSLTKDHTHLKSIQKISFYMCNISQAFGKEAGRISRALPNVVEISIDYCRDLVELEDDICNLVHLEKLSITNCHRISALPENLGKLTNLEVLNLRSCSDLVNLPSTIGALKKLNFLDISHCFSIKELPEEIGALSSLRKLNMVECSRLQELPESVIALELEVVICDKYTQELWEMFTPISTEIRVVKPQFNLLWLQMLHL